MKFIGGIQKAKVIDNILDIYIETFHRSATGALTGTKLYYYPKRTKDTLDTDKDDNKHINELAYKEIIISQYPPVIWNNIFRIKFWVKDKPGITQRILKILDDLEINIETQESIMTRYNSLFSISLIANFTEYCKENDCNKERNDTQNKLENKRKNLEAKLVEVFDKKFKQETISDSRPPTVKKLELLNINTFDFGSKSENLIDKKTLKRKYVQEKNYKSVSIYNGIIKLKKDILKDIEIDELSDISYTVNSDTEEKYILIRFFEKDQYITQIDIKHNSEDRGVIRDLSEEISSTDKKYNIINSYNRIQDFDINAHWVVMIDCSSDPAKVLTLIKKLKSNEHSIDVKEVSSTNVFYETIPELLDDHKEENSSIKTENEVIISKQNNKIDKLKNELKTEKDKNAKIEKEIKFIIIKKALKKWRIPAYISIFGLFVILVFFILSFSFLDNKLNIIVDFFSWGEQQAEFQRDLIKWILSFILGGLGTIFVRVIWTRLIKSEAKMKFIEKRLST